MKKLLLISCLCIGSLNVATAQDNKDKTSTSNTGKNTAGEIKTKLDELFNSALGDFKAKQYDKSLSTITVAEGVIKSNNINTEKRFVDLKDAVIKAKNTTTTTTNTSGTNKTNTGANSELKSKLDNLFEAALGDYKAGQYDKALVSVSNAEQLLKNNNMTDIRFSDLKNSINQAKAKQTSNTNDGKTNTNDGKSNTTDGKSNTTDGKSNTNDGKSNTNDGKSNTNDGKTNTTSGSTGSTNDGKSNTTSGSTGNASNNSNTKVKLDVLFNSALGDFKAKQYDKSLSTISEAEGLIKNNNLTTEKRFADLKDAVIKAKNTTSTTTSTSGTNKTSTGANSELKAKLDNLFESALGDYKAGQYDKALISVSNAEQLLKNNNMTDVRFSDLKNSINQAKAKQNTNTNDGKSNTNDGKTNTNDGKSNTTAGSSSNTANDTKAKLENFYKDAVSAVNSGKYEVASNIIADAEKLMKSTNTMDNRFDNLKKEIALKTKK